MSTVFVGKLPFDANERELDDMFKVYGPIGRINIKRGYAFIEFTSEMDAEAAVREAHGKIFAGDAIVVEIAKGRRTERANCFVCGRSDHWARECPQRGQPPAYPPRDSGPRRREPYRDRDNRYADPYARDRPRFDRPSYHSPPRNVAYSRDRYYSVSPPRSRQPYLPERIPRSPVRYDDRNEQPHLAPPRSPEREQHPQDVHGPEMPPNTLADH